MIKILPRSYVKKVLLSNSYVRHNIVESNVFLSQKLLSINSSRVRRDSDIAIIGYPRCGNSFTRDAIQYLQKPGSIAIASHNHYISQLKEAVEYRIPTLLLVRDPSNAVSSFVVRNPEISTETALRRYIWFYRSALVFLNDVCFSQFSEAVSQPDRVIERINAKYSTSFSHRNMNSSDFVLIKQQHQTMEKKHFGDRLQATGVVMSVPNPEKENLKSEIVLNIQKNYPSLLSKAEFVYGQFPKWSSDTKMKVRQ